MEKEKDLSQMHALKYKPEYAKQLYEHMKSGGGLSHFNVTPKVWPSTIYDWIKDHEDFRFAKETGKQDYITFIVQLAYYTLLKIDLPENLKRAGSNGIDTKMLRFLLKTKGRDEYSEKVHNVIQNPDGSKIQVASMVDVSKLSLEELEILEKLHERMEKGE